MELTLTFEGLEPSDVLAAYARSVAPPSLFPASLALELQGMSNRARWVGPAGEGLGRSTQDMFAAIDDAVHAALAAAAASPVPPSSR